MEEAANEPGLQLVRLDDPQIGDLQQVTLSFLQLAQHQFAIFLKSQGVHTLPDGTLGLDPALIHRLRTTGIEGLSFSQTVDPMADIESRMSAIVEGIAHNLSRRQNPPMVDAPINAPAPAAPAAPATPQAAPGTRYPLGRMLAGGGR